MPHLLLTSIEWDCDGMRPLEDCNLPVAILALHAPGDMAEDELEEHLGELLSETYGFLHDGFQYEQVTPDGEKRREWPQHMAVMDATD